eukprot:TRINITY_DN5652_c0_g1_i8.p1 TRINITY_DN5652_c0_g1~~TRINITY_DN5652_c0_g1_i8.p1  ORF type:complete len:348 (+),score=145.88 TRINITY_DN5652_c0_g1_i8:98-1045(+)
MARVTEEMRLVSGGFRMAYKHWRPAGGAAATQRMLCYPGWLDNAGSFDNIAPLLVQQGWELVCPDPPGCGYSQHHPPYGTYNDFEEVPLALGLVEELGWTTGPQFTACGHSRGAAVMIMFTASFPEYVKSLIILDNSLLAPPSSLFDKGAIANLQGAVVFDKKNTKRADRVFNTFDEAVALSAENKMFRKSYDTSANITRRHVKQQGDGKWVYTHDTRQYGQRQKFFPSPDMLEQFTSHLQCPVLQVLAEEGMPWPKVHLQLAEKRRSVISNLVEVTVAGGHHVHSDNASGTFAAMKEFLKQSAAIDTQCRKAKL